MIKKEMRFFWVWNRVRIWRNGRHTKNQEYLPGNKPRWLPQNLPNCWQGELNFVLKPRSRAAVLPMSLLYKCRKENEILYVWTCGEHLRAEWRIKILTLNLVYHYLLWRWRFFLYVSVGNKTVSTRGPEIRVTNVVISIVWMRFTILKCPINLHKRKKIVSRLFQVEKVVFSMIWFPMWS